MKLHFKILSQS